MPAGRALIVADDLTGAADCAAQALRHGLTAAVALRPDTGVEADVLALDLDTRQGGARAAYAATRDAAASGAPLLYVKLDSLLRGQTAREVIHVRDGVLDRPGVLVCDAENEDEQRILELAPDLERATIGRQEACDVALPELSLIHI